MLSLLMFQICKRSLLSSIFCFFFVFCFQHICSLMCTCVYKAQCLALPLSCHYQCVRASHFFFIHIISSLFSLYSVRVTHFDAITHTHARKYAEHRLQRMCLRLDTYYCYYFVIISHANFFLFLSFFSFCIFAVFIMVRHIRLESTIITFESPQCFMCILHQKTKNKMKETSKCN